MENVGNSLSWRKVFTVIVNTIGFLSAIIGVYTYFFVERKVSVEYEIIANTNVLDINANISKLDITYNGISLKNNKQNLRILNIKIKNNGTESILKGDYDLNDPVGILIKDGKIIENPEVISTSNNYLKKNLKVRLDTGGKVLFNDLILEPNQHFTIKLLVLHIAGINPNVISIGKIAGQNEIPVTISNVSRDKKSFWYESLNASLSVQAFRFIVYGVIFLIVLVLIIIAIFYFSEYLDKRKRIHLVDDFKKLESYHFSKMDDAIFSRFENDDVSDLSSFIFALREEKSLNDRYKSEKIKNGIFLYDVNKMLNDGLIFKDGNDVITINHAMKNTLTKFLEFLKEKKYINNSYSKISR